MRKRKSRRGSSHLCQRKVTVRRQSIREITRDLQVSAHFSHWAWILLSTMVLIPRNLVDLKCSSQQSPIKSHFQPINNAVWIHTDPKNTQFDTSIWNRWNSSAWHRSITWLMRKTHGMHKITHLHLFVIISDNKPISLKCSPADVVLAKGWWRKESNK